MMDDAKPSTSKDVIAETQVASTSSSAASKKSHESVPPQQEYIIKPALEDKFKPGPVKEIIVQSLTRTLTGKTYDEELVKTWTASIANNINLRVKELNLKRYKHVVQVTIGEMRGAGLKAGFRCVWDSDTDSYTSETFMNDTIFAIAAVFGIYLY